MRHCRPLDGSAAWTLPRTGATMQALELHQAQASVALTMKEPTKALAPKIALWRR